MNKQGFPVGFSPMVGRAELFMNYKQVQIEEINQLYVELISSFMSSIMYMIRGVTCMLLKIVPNPVQKVCSTYKPNNSYTCPNQITYILVSLT